MKKTLIFIFITTWFSVSCVSQPKKEKKTNYRLDNQPFVLKDTLLLDTNAIYIEQMNPENQDGQKIYTFLRFFANGQVFSSEAYDHEPTEIECNNLQNGQKGYYRIENGEIKMELRTRTSTHFEYYFLKILGQKLHLYKYKGRTELIPIHKKLDVWYEKKKVNLSSKCDW